MSSEKILSDRSWFSVNQEDGDELKNTIQNLIQNMLYDISENAVNEVESHSVMRREKKTNIGEKQLETDNRLVSITYDQCGVECRNNSVHLHGRAASECVIISGTNDDDCSRTHDEKNVNITENEKKTKKISFTYLFGRKDKKYRAIKEEEEKHDNLSQLPVFHSNTLRKSRRYASAEELNDKSSTHRTSSFLRKVVHIGEASMCSLKRSFSFRGLNKKQKRVYSRDEVMVQKNDEWRQSLQSLVETDTGVSYKDLSFINYDPLNDINYQAINLTAGRTSNKGFIGRTQSMIEKVSPNLRKPVHSRLSSVTDISGSAYNLPRSSTLSLSSLRHIDVDIDHTYGCISPINRYSKSSISDHTGSLNITGDGKGVSYPTYSSERSEMSGSGCVKLEEQEVRNWTPSVVNRNSIGKSNDMVRSLSLDNLDNSEMRQGVISAVDVHLKDTRSEPDCTKSSLATPSASHEATSPSTKVPPARKHRLSRSQRSSSECFSVNFEVGDEGTRENELFYPAQRGITLYDSLAKLCELQNVDLSACDVLLQDKDGDCENFISFHQDTAGLAGRHVRIKAKDSSNKKLTGSFHSNHLRKQSGHHRPRTTSSFSSSTEDAIIADFASSTISLHDGDHNKKQMKQRLTSFFGNVKDPKYEALIDQLDIYSRQGIPNVSKYPRGQCESIDALYELEDDWREIIECDDLNEKQQQQQTALWELIKTEVAYIRTLKVVTDLFLACLKDLQSRNLLGEINTDILFSNITEILDANIVFWRNVLFPPVRDMRKYKRPPCLKNLVAGFESISDIFQPYYKYCSDQSKCQHFCRENLESEVFTAYLSWCESQKKCNRLRLMDILVQPMQRLTKYGLLLKAILRNTEEEEERENVQRMIKLVDDFVNNVNSNLKHRQDKERLKGIIARIETYDIVDSKDDDIDRLLRRDKSLSQLDLTRPMLNCPAERKRHLLLEGDLKLKDSSTSKMEVHCFLLTDMMLVCKPSAKKGSAIMRVIRQPYLVDRLVVSELQRETPSLAIIYKNEFDMAIAVFILQNNDARKMKGWKDGIAKAQCLYAQAKQRDYIADESIDTDCSFDCCLENDFGNIQLASRSPLANSSRASRVSSLGPSYSGSVEMNEQSSVGSINHPSRAVSVDNEDRTGSLSSDEGVQPLPPDKSTVIQKNSLKTRLFHKTPNTLSVQPHSSLGQSLPNLTLSSPNASYMSLNSHQNTLLVPSSKNGCHLLSPSHRGISYPPPSPTRGNLKRSSAISQSKNPPLIKTRQVSSATSISQQFDSHVPVTIQK